MGKNDGFSLARAVSRIPAVGMSESDFREVSSTPDDSGSCIVRTGPDARLALTVFSELRPDLVLIECDNVQLDTLSTVVQIGSQASEDGFLPVVVSPSPASRP